MTPEEQAEKIKLFRQELTDVKYPVTDEASWIFLRVNSTAKLTCRHLVPRTVFDSS